MHNRVAIVHNIVSPYKTLLFNSLFEQIGCTLKVLYCTSTSRWREWNINYEKIGYPYDLLYEGNLEDISKWELAKKVFFWLNRFEPEVVIAGGYDILAMWAAWLWSAIYRKRFIVNIESHEQDRARIFWKEQVKRLFFSRCSAVIVAGSKHRDYVIKLGVPSHKVYVMKGVGGVDDSSYALSRNINEPDNIAACVHIGVPIKKYFIYVGRFAQEKNIMTLLRAYKDCANLTGWDDWGILLVGNGPMWDEIQQFIVQHQLNNIVCPGFIQQDCLPAYYAASEVFVLPSISEPWGLVVDEAMTMGLAVIVSDCCGCVPDIVHDGINGITFNPLQDTELKVAIGKVISGEIDIAQMRRNSLNIIKECGSDNSARIWAQAISGSKN